MILSLCFEPVPKEQQKRGGEEVKVKEYRTMYTAKLEPRQKKKKKRNRKKNEMI